MDNEYKIVIGEDHTILREGLRSLLSVHPELNVVGEAEDGLDVIRRVEKLSPDLVLMDIRLVGQMDGIEAAQEIRGFSTAPIVFVTGYHDERFKEAAMKVQPAAYLVKPIRRRDIEQALKIL